MVGKFYSVHGPGYFPVERHVRANQVEDMDQHIAAELVAKVPHWHHKFRLMDGVDTPGSYDPGFLLKLLALPTDMRGIRALDIGPSDGFFSMHMALRGADVTSVDYRAKATHGFAAMEAVTGLKFDYRQANLYELNRCDLGGFDIVLFLGVLYHLPDMIRALNIVNQLCDGRLLLETAYEPDLLPGTTVARYYESATLANDRTNFWVPNRECILAMLGDCSFEVDRDEAWGSRILVDAHAQATAKSDKMVLAYGRVPG